MRLPLSNADFRGFPINRHPGAFGAVRLHDIHTGIDLYCRDGTSVFAMVDGEVVAYEQFTGPPRFPWWNTTYALIVKPTLKYLERDDLSRTIHYICYGEIVSHLQVGDKIYKGTIIGNVKAVLPPDRIRKDIPGHSNAMLHLEMYDETYDVEKNYWDIWDFGDVETKIPVVFPITDQRPKYLIDPTPLLARYHPNTTFLTL